MIINSSILLLLSNLCCLTLAGKVFRTEKINFVYQKAMHHIGDKQRLLKLEGDLESYDNMYLATKDTHFFAEDNGAGLKKDLSRIDDKLVKLLKKYDLEQTVNAFKEAIERKDFKRIKELMLKMKHKQDLSHAETEKDLSSARFEDEVIQSIWEKALLSKLSEKKLQAIYTELRKAEAKMSHYENVLKEFNKVPENDIDSDHVTEQEDDKNKRLKEAHKSLHDHLDDIRGNLSKPYQDQFESVEARALWKLAQTKKHTPESLAVLREEIMLFDKQLQKQELIKNKKEHHSGDEPGSKQDHIVEAELNAKDELMNRKIKKLGTYLKDKIVHKEL